jgi:hypothetical protein
MPKADGEIRIFCQNSLQLLVRASAEGTLIVAELDEYWEGGILPTAQPGARRCQNVPMFLGQVSEVLPLFSLGKIRGERATRTDHGICEHSEERHI